jgi:hypothetical protein
MYGKITNRQSPTTIILLGFALWGLMIYEVMSSSLDK